MQRWSVAALDPGMKPTRKHLIATALATGLLTGTTGCTPFTPKPSTTDLATEALNGLRNQFDCRRSVSMNTSVCTGLTNPRNGLLGPTRLTLIGKDLRVDKALANAGDKHIEPRVWHEPNTAEAGGELLIIEIPDAGAERSVSYSISLTGLVSEGITNLGDRFPSGRSKDDSTALPQRGDR